jgi:glyceraldehyde 3-phosphate dehydrogenase
MTKKTLRIAINGFGRIGRLTLRALLESAAQDIHVVAINDLSAPKTNAHLFKYDSIHGPFKGHVALQDTALILEGHPNIAFLQERNPEDLPWSDLNVDIVFECSGVFTTRDTAAAHLKAGAKRVIISAPATDVDLTVVCGVNDTTLTKDHHVISNASCTTNCLAPIAKVLHETCGIKHGFMTTIHAFTGDQRLVDTNHSDLHRARAATQSMIPTSTGAARAVGLVLPELKGKIDGTAIRVPTPNVSVVDFKFVANRPVTADEINTALQKAATVGPLKGILGICDLPLVSIDFNHNPLSSIADITQTHVVDSTFCRVLSWYDNEWGFSNRMLDTARVMGRFL